MVEQTSLQQLLQKELTILDELSSLSHLKTNAIMNDDLNAVEEIVLREEALTKSLKKIDNACSPQVQFFLKGSVKQRPAFLTESVKKLRESAQRLQANNELNQHLLRVSLNLVTFTLNTLLPPTDGGVAVYGSSGKVLNRRRKNIVLDTKG